MRGDPVPELRMFGQRLQRHRLQRGWSLRDLAAKADVASASTINRVENGKGDIWLSAAVKLAAALEVSLDELLAEPVCAKCDGHPPAGFTCNECGSTDTHGPIRTRTLPATEYNRGAFA